MIDALRTVSPSTRITVLGALATSALGAVLCFLPGLDAPNYHAAFVSAIGGSLLTGPVGIFAAHRALALRKNPFVAALRSALPAALAPLALLLMNGVRVRQCDVFSGVAFMLVGPVFSMLWAALFGAAIAVWRPKLRHALPLFYLAFLCWAALDVLHIYRNPSIFAYNPFAGFFSGALYDAVIVIDSRLALYRLNNVAQILTLIAFARATWDPALRRPSLARLSRAGFSRVVPFVLAAAVSLAFWVSRAEIGYEVSRADVKATLGREISDERITLVHDRSIPESEARDLLEAHRFRLEQIEARLGRTFPRRITSYVYASSDQKRRLMGAGQVYIAKPWLDEIHLNRVSHDHPVIRHELAHVVLGLFADPPMHIPTRACIIPQMALVEGAAEAFEWDTGQLSPHEWSAAMRAARRAPDLRSLLGPSGFYNQGSETAYTISGSFVRWVIDRFGIDKLALIYRDGDFEAALGQPIGALVADWERFLDGLSVPDDAAGLATGRFNTPAIHRRPCGLDVARVEAEARELRRLGDRAGARAAYQQVIDWIPEDAQKRRPLVEMAAAAADLERTLGAYVAYTLIPNNRNPVDDAAMTELMADTFARRALGSPDPAPLIERAHRLYASLSEVPQPELRWRNALVKVYLAADLERATHVLPYLLNGRSDDLQRAADAFPDDPLVDYLVARRVYNERRYDEAVPLLARTVATLHGRGQSSEHAWAPWVHREAARLLAHAHWELGDLAAAEDVFRFVATLTPYGGDRERYLDWAERCAWKRARANAR